MKKIGMVLVMSILFIATASAYNPPKNGEGFMEFATPKLLSGTLSTAGGALFTISPESIVINPAITATEQRTDLNLAYTALFSGNDLSLSRYGNIIQTAILIPSKLYIFTGMINYTSVGFEEMNLSNSLNVKAALSKQITDKLDVGLGVNLGFLFTADFDWALSANLGGLYKWGDLGFIKDFRIGASLNNLGKAYKSYTISSLLFSEEYAYAPTGFPNFCDIRLGVAGQLITTDVVKLGMSLDFETPLFQNFIFSLGLNFAFKDMFYLTVLEKINLTELSRGHAHYIPAVGLSYKFRFNVKNIKYIEDNDWSQSEMRVSAAYKNIYQTVNAVSADVDITLGLKDDKPPVIQLWNDEGDEE